MDAFEILVLILSVFLAICLMLTTVAMVYVVKIVKNIKHISDKASSIVEDASSAAAMVKKVAAPATVAKFVAEQISEAVSKHNKNKEDKE